MSNIKISMFDNVRVRHSTITDDRGLSGKQGQVYGETTPSSTGVEVIGELIDDYAINVSIEGHKDDLWFAPELLEFVDHAQGTEVVVGKIKAVRSSDGSWTETESNTNKSRWKFWK